MLRKQYHPDIKVLGINESPEEDHSFTKNTAEAALYVSDWLSKQIHKERCE